jgi:hypothetical protein
MEAVLMLFYHPGESVRGTQLLGVSENPDQIPEHKRENSKLVQTQ